MSQREQVRHRSSERRMAIAAVAFLAALASAAVALPAGSSASAGAATPPIAPAVASASLDQHGQQLRLTVTLSRSFRDDAFAAGGSSLCLLLERHESGALASELCVTPPRRHHRALRLERVTAGHGAVHTHVIAATVSRHGTRSLTATFLPRGAGIGYSTWRWQIRDTNGTEATLFPARARLVRLHVPKLVGCRASGRSLRFAGSSSRREIALSFDDGPWNDPPTIDFIRLLARYHVPATFFEIGDQISTYDRSGAVERKMLADGDMIGDHTWTHPDMTTLTPSEQTSQLERTAHAIRHATGFTPCLWRPPYGDISGQLDSLARRLGFLTIYWDIDPRDWSLPGTAAIERTVLSNARNGGIVEMHFGGGPRLETLHALPTIITKLRKRGYRFVTITQLLHLKMIYR